MGLRLPARARGINTNSALTQWASSSRITATVPKASVNTHIVCRGPNLGSCRQFTGDKMVVIKPRLVPSAL